MESFNNNIPAGTQSKYRKKMIISRSLIFIALLVKCPSCWAGAEQQNKNASATCVDNSLYESTTIDPNECQDVRSFCLTKECLQSALDLMRDMDLEADPCEDFYQFTCGNWAEHHPKPDPSMGHFDWFVRNRENNLALFRTFLQSTATVSEPKAIKQMRNMYAACMDMDTNQTDNESGIRMTVDYLKQLRLPQYPTALRSINNRAQSMKSLEWVKSIARIKKVTGLDVIIGFDIKSDPINQTNNHIWFGSKQKTNLFNSQGSDFETKFDDDDKIDIEAGWISNIINLNNRQEIKIHSDIRRWIRKRLELKSTLNEVTEEIEMMMDMIEDNSMRLMTIDDFQRSTNQLIAPETTSIWREYFNEMFKDIKPSINLHETKILINPTDLYYLQKVTKIFSGISRTDLDFYIWYDFVIAIRNLYSNEAQMTPKDTIKRSLECTLKVLDSMSMAASYVITETNFLNETKPKVDEMAENIRSAFYKSIKEEIWIDKKTENSILKKLNATKTFVGIPDWAFDRVKLDAFYADLNLTETFHMKNLFSLQQWQMNKQLKRIHSIDDMEWMEKPIDMNAFHFYERNAIAIHPAMMQYPFYNVGIDALNYGALGWIIGREFTHGFDSIGRKFDKNGNHQKWWRNETISELELRTHCFINQYDQLYVPEAELNINGTLTLAENIADHGGLRHAYHAYIKMYSNKVEKDKVLPGFEHVTHDQLFFISFGHSLCETHTKSWMMTSLREDSNAPKRFRVNGALENSNEFKKAFHCRSDSEMVLKESKKCRIW